MSQALPVIIIFVAALLAFVAGVVIARRKGCNTRTGQVVARCRKGHLFTTVWNAPPSVHRIDLGWARIQRCPVGNHLTLVVMVKDSELTAEERRIAKETRDSGVG